MVPGPGTLFSVEHHYGSCEWFLLMVPEVFGRRFLPEAADGRTCYLKRSTQDVQLVGLVAFRNVSLGNRQQTFCFALFVFSSQRRDENQRILMCKQDWLDQQLESRKSKLESVESEMSGQPRQRAMAGAGCMGFAVVLVPFGVASLCLSMVSDVHRIFSQFSL